MILLQTASEYASNVALGTGVLVVLVVVAYILASRRVGRERDEWDHEKTINRQLRTLSRTHQVRWTGDLQAYRNDIDYLLGGVTTRRRFGWARHIAASLLSRWSRYADRAPESPRPPIMVRQRQWLRRRLPVGVTGHAMPVTDADGRRIFVASVNGRRMAHRDREKLLRDVETVVEALVDGDTPPGTVSEHYYQDITEGFVDLRESRSRLRGDCRTRIQSNVREEGTLDLSKLRRRLIYDDGFRYPPEIVETMLERLEGREVRQRQDGTLTYQRFGNA